MNENGINFENNHFQRGSRPNTAIALLGAFFIGLLGGVFGSVIVLNSPEARKILGSAQPGGIGQSSQITLTEESAVINVVKKAGPAVVSIVVTKDLSKIPGYGTNPFEGDDFFRWFFGENYQQPSGPNIQQIGAGTGFFVESDGLILTNRHVVSDEQANYTVITQDGKKYDAKVMARDPVNDLAIVKINISGAHVLELGDSESLQVGQKVVAIGNSLGQYQNTVTSGIISGVGRRITAGVAGRSEQLSGVIQTDAAINPGNSGGPLLNVQGQVIGINTAINQEGQLVGFAIPSGDAAKALQSYRKNGKITRPFLGVRYIMLNKEIAEQENLPRDFGALVVRGQNISDLAVVPGSPADKAGLAENDIILEVDGRKLDGDNTLSDELKKYNPGDSVNLRIYHRGEEKEVRVALEESR